LVFIGIINFLFTNEKNIKDYEMSFEVETFSLGERMLKGYENDISQQIKRYNILEEVIDLRYSLGNINRRNWYVP
jgi:hypothetical protein